MAKKKHLPPQTLKCGDTVKVDEIMGVVSGNQLSPGGMRDYVDVTFFVAFHSDAGLKNYVRRTKIAVGRCIPVTVDEIDFNDTYSGDMSQAAGFVEYDTAD